MKTSQGLDRVVDTRPARRTRSRGLSALHQEQIETSRRRILAAAEAAFLRHSYVGATVDTIIATAGVSRATFYKYFPSKFDIAKGLIESFVPKLEAAYDALPEQPDPGPMRDWVKRFLRLYEENRQFTLLLGEVHGAEPDFFPVTNRINDGLIARLGRRIPAFARAEAGRAEGTAAYVAAHLLIQQVSAFCFMVASRGWRVDIEGGAAYVADQLARFVADAPPRSDTAVQ